jgi:hypothetical protein
MRTHFESDQGARSWRAVELGRFDADVEAGHLRSQPLGHEFRGLDGDCGGKNARKKRVQGAATVDMTAAVIPIVGHASTVIFGLHVVMMHMSVGRAPKRLSALQRRRNDTRQLGGQKQDDQRTGQPGYRPQPLHQAISGPHRRRQIGPKLAAARRRRQCQFGRAGRFLRWPPKLPAITCNFHHIIPIGPQNRSSALFFWLSSSAA